MCIQRRAKLRQPEAYINALDKHAEQRKVATVDLPLEFMMNGLRLIEGVNIGAYQQRTGPNLAELEPVIQRLVNRGWLRYRQADTESKLAPTTEGLLFLNEVITSFSC